MSSAAVEPWAKAVRMQDAGKTYYVTLEHLKPVNQAISTEQTRHTYEVVVVDALQSRAWRGSFTYQDIHDAVLQEHMADLRPLEVDNGLANCFSNGQIAFQWTGVDGSQVHIEAMYRRGALATVPIRLPPQGEMQVQRAQGFNELNARVLDILLQQNSQLQAQTSLQAMQLQALTNHVQKVQDSYSDAIASIAANLVCEHAHLSPTTRQQAAAAVSPGATGNKRRRVNAADAAFPEAAPGQQSQATASVATLSSPAAGTVRAQQQQQQQQQQHDALPLGYNQQSQRPPPGAASGHATAEDLSGSSRQLDRTPLKGKSRQLSSEEKLKQRIVNMQRRLQQDWEGWVQQLLQAQGVAEAQAVVSGSRLPQHHHHQQRHPVEQPLGLQAGLLQGMTSPQQMQQTLEFASQHVIPNSQAEGALTNVVASQQVGQLQPADARLVPEQHAQQQAALGDTVPGDDDKDDDVYVEQEPGVVVHKARARSRAVGRALAGLRKR